jgi:hypothetical protein
MCPTQIWKVGKIGKVGKVGKFGMVGKAGKIGKEGRLREELFPTLNQILQQSNKNGEKINEKQKNETILKNVCFGYRSRTGSMSCQFQIT